MIPRFRAWVKPDILSNHLNGVIAEALPNFIYGNCLVLREDLEEDKQFEEIIDFLDIELMQSTGLKDKNGVEIFEGDVVAVENHPFQRKEDSGAGIEIEGNYVVGWSQHDLTWCAGDLLLARLKSYVRVIGNIYENSELLGTMLKIFAIKADSDDQEWMDSFNGWNDSNYFLDQKIDEKEVELLERKIDKFNHEVACGLAIRLEEQR